MNFKARLCGCIFKVDVVDGELWKCRRVDINHYERLKIEDVILAVEI